MTDSLKIPESLIQICETHQDRSFHVGRKGKKEGSGADTQGQMPKWDLTTHSIQPQHPLTAWLWLNDPLFRVAPDQLRQRLILDATTEWQERCANLDFPRILNRKKALEGLGALKPELMQARAAMIAMERYSQDSPLLWILWNDEEKKVSFLDDKLFPRDGGYKQIWIIREPTWDRLWDASSWSSADLVSWIQKEEETFKVEWPLEPAASTLKSMASEYSSLNYSPVGLSKDQLRFKLGRTKAIRKLLN